MKRFSFLLFVLCATNTFAQQEIRVDSHDYQQLKASGQLEGLKIISSSKAGEMVEDYIMPTQTGGGGDDDVCDCWLAPDSDYSLAMTPNDDGSSQEIDLPFDFCLYGENFNTCYINNNGNVSFGSSYGTFTADAFPSPNFVMVAPFWGDVDTSGGDGGEVWYKVTETALYVNWVEVGYFPSTNTLVNSFQVIITSGQDPVVPNGNNISFCYLDMQWTTGGASGGVGGFGGSPATVGANLGDGQSYIQLGQFDQPGNAFDGPFDNNDGVDWLDNKYFILNSCVDGNNIAPFTSSSGVCDTLSVCQGGAASIIFLGPEEDQTITTTYESEDEDNITVSSTSDEGSSEVVIGVSDELPAGTYQVTITATDDGEPALSTTVIYFINVVEDNSPPLVIEGPEGLCIGGTGVLSVADEYDEYSWNTGSDTHTTQITGPGVYTVTALTDICLKFDDFEVEELPVPEPTVEGQLLICANATTELTVVEDYASYLWSNGDEEQTTEVAQGTYTLTVVNDQGCEGSIDVIVGNLPVPVLPVDQTVCGYEFVVEGIEPNFNGLWTAITGQGQEASFDPETEINSTINVEALGSYDFEFVDECGISAEMVLNFIPIADFIFPDESHCEGDDVIVTPEGDFKDYFIWSWELDGEDLENSSYYQDFTESGYYTFTATNECGSQIDSAEYIAIGCDITIPNVFSPNADNWNNAFTIDGLGFFPNSEIQIYDRWGGLIFQSPSYNNSWDGEGAAEGTYYYILKLRLPEGDIVDYSGHVTLFRK